MPRLDIDFVKYLSLVDEPAVDDARYLVTKRHESAESGRAEGVGTSTDGGDGTGEQQSADPAEAAPDAARSEADSLPMDENDLNERLEEQHEETIEAATEAASEAATEAVEKALEDADFGGAGSEDGTDDRNLTDADLDELEKRLGDSEDDGDVDVSDERRKEIEAVVKGMDGDGRKAHATQTAGEGEGEQFTDRFVADAGGDA